MKNETDNNRSDKYVVISADCHAGADLRDYRPYLDARFRDEFDVWAANYTDAWSAFDPGERRMGVASFLDPINWESAKRIEMLEEQGVVAEILFPNTVPPFYPSGAITAPGPRTAEEYERRWAGVQAHNRWLAEFCADAPSRRAGIAQLFLNNVENAVREVEWARGHGLMGVLLPADHHLGLQNLYYPVLDPLWEACESLEMPVHRHGVQVNENTPAAGVGAGAIGIIESCFFGQRGLA